MTAVKCLSVKIVIMGRGFFHREDNVCDSQLVVSDKGRYRHWQTMKLRQRVLKRKMSNGVLVMINAVFPQTIFTTQKRFNDYGAEDMRYGDLSEERLKKEFGLKNISNVVNPYTLTRLTAFDTPQNRFAGVYGDSYRSEKVSVQECARLLFEEMQVTSLPYSLVGSYRHLINQMLRHFQRSSGMPFRDSQLDAAWRQKINSDYAANTTKSRVHKSIGRYIDYNSKGISRESLMEIKGEVMDSLLPTFNSPVMDKINGMGITVHGVYATKIEILRLEVDERGWQASIKFTGQDHFGLDEEDICKKKFNQLQFFRIWFILQRFNRFGFRPFMTDMEAVISIGGER